jgi:dihydrofolate reductase
MKSNAGLNIIVAIAENGVIGAHNQLPWRLPADLKHFKQLTFGHTVIMGRKTFESLGKPLPGRCNIVLSRQHNLANEQEDILIASDLNAALAKAPKEKKIFIIGGAALYAETLNLAEKIYLTEVLANVPGDTYFPTWDKSQWLCVESLDHAADENHPYPFRFSTWEKMN